MNVSPRRHEPAGLFEALASTQLGQVDRGGGALRPRLPYAFDLPIDVDPIGRVDDLTQPLTRDDGDVGRAASTVRPEAPARATHRVESVAATPREPHRSAPLTQSEPLSRAPDADPRRELSPSQLRSPHRIEPPRQSDPARPDAIDPARARTDRVPMREGIVNRRSITTFTAVSQKPASAPTIRPVPREPALPPTTARPAMALQDRGLASRSQPETTIEIHIGRVEVRAPGPSAAKTATPQRAASDRRLSAYLQRRAAGARS
jgi:hypothetical protein